LSEGGGKMRAGPACTYATQDSASKDRQKIFRIKTGIQSARIAPRDKSEIPILMKRKKVSHGNRMPRLMRNT
jgi:hypothetical protein